MARLYRKSALEKLSSPDQLDRAIVIASPMSWLVLIGVLIIIAGVLVWSFVSVIPETITSPGLMSVGIETGGIYSSAPGKITKIGVKVGETVSPGDELCTITDSLGNLHAIIADSPAYISSCERKVGETVNQGDLLFGISPIDYGQMTVVCFVPYSEIARLERGMSVDISPDGIDTSIHGVLTGKIELIDSYAAGVTQLSKLFGDDSPMLEYLTAGEMPMCALTCTIDADDSSQNGFAWSRESGKSLTLPTRALVSVSITVDETKPIAKLIPGLGEDR